jgi:hypothetical protein
MIKNYFISACLLCLSLSTVAMDETEIASFEKEDKAARVLQKAARSYRFQANKQEIFEGMYRQGLLYRDGKEGYEKDLTRAGAHFFPLAYEGDVKAQHNLAMVYYQWGNYGMAYQWLKKAADQNFQPSINNLGRMNLLCLLLPNDILSHVASFFRMEEVACFNLVSYRSHRVITSTITSTNFLTSSSPYALKFLSYFEKVDVIPKPSQLRLVQFAKAWEGSIEVRFRDSKHLKEIVEATPKIEASKNRILFVRDQSVEDGEEIMPTIGTLERNYFIHFVADAPLKARGKISHTLPLPIHLPRASDFNDVLCNVKGGMAMGDLPAYSDANALARAIDTFDGQLFKIRTADAYQLLEDRRLDRKTSSRRYPPLNEVCPNACLITTSPLEIKQNDYIYSQQPFIYIARSTSDLFDLQSELPDYKCSISYVDSDCIQPGVYCNGPLVLNKGFEVYCEGDITIAGNLSGYGYNNLEIVTKGSFWNGGTIAWEFVTIYFEKESYNGLPYKKPAAMPQEHWARYLSYLKKQNQNY